MKPGVVNKVHHSYIWLGGFKAFLATLVGVAVGVAGSVPSIVEGLEKAGASLSSANIMLIAAISALVVALIVGVFVVGFWLSWKHLGYEVAPDQFNLYKGVFSKKRLHVPYQRVQSVDIRATLLQRIAGVCSVEIDTAGGSANKAVIVPYVTKTDAERLRHELFARKQAAVSGVSVASGSGAFVDAPGSMNAGGARAVEGNVLDELGEVFSDAWGIFDQGGFSEAAPVSFEAKLSNKELLLSGLSDIKSVGGAIVLALVGIFGFVLGFEPVSAAFEHWIAGLVGARALAGDAAGFAAMAFATRLIPAFALAFVAAALVIAVLSAISSVLSYGNFAVRRRGGRIEVERGLLQHQIQGVDVDRVQFVRVEHGWIRRKLGYCKVYLGRIDSTASNDGAGNSSMASDSSKGMVVHPFLAVDALPGLLEELVPEVDFAFDDGCSCNPPARAKRRAVVRAALWHSAGFWTLACLAACAVVALIFMGLRESPHLAAAQAVVFGLWPLYLVSLLDMVVGVIRGLKWHAASSLAYDERLVRIVNEGFTREEVVVPRQKIQFAYSRANPFQAAAKVRCLLVTTAAGVGSTSERIFDIDEEQADAFLDWTRPRR